MATIINTPNQDSGSGAGWAVAVGILLVVLIAAYFGFTRWGGGNSTSAPSADINVTVPTGSTGGGPAQ